jgi:hypothetical protein
MSLITSIEHAHLEHLVHFKIGSSVIQVALDNTIFGID